MLSSVGAISAAAVPATVFARSGEPHPDAELIALGHQLESAQAEYERMGKRCDELLRQSKERAPLKPETLIITERDFSAFGHLYGLDLTVGHHYERRQAILLSNRRHQIGADLARADEIVAIHTKWQERATAIENEVGYTRASEEVEAAAFRMHHFENAIEAAQARTIEGLQIKARLVKWSAEHEGTDEFPEAIVWPHGLMWTIVRDLLALPPADSSASAAA